MTIKKAFLIIGIVLAFHALGLIFNLYEVFGWYDIPMHLGGGLAMGALGLAIWNKGKIRLADVAESLGIINQETLFRAAGFIINKDTKGALQLVGDILNSGKDAKQFLVELLEHFRNVMIIKTGISSEELIGLPKEAIENIKTQSQGLSQGDIFYVINIISNGLKMIKQLLPERIVMELCMVRLTSRDSISSIEEIISKLPELDKHASSSHGAVASASKNTPKNIIPEKGHHHIKNDTPAPSGPDKIEKANSHDSSGVSPIVEISRVRDAWPILVKAMAVRKMSTSTYLSEGAPDSVNGNTILIAFPRQLNFHREVLEEKHNKDSVEAALSQILDMQVRLQFVATDREMQKPETAEGLTVTKEELKKKEPIIDTALNIFGGKILRSTRNA